MKEIIKHQELSCDEMMSYISNLIDSFIDIELKNLCKLFISEYEEAFKYYPAGIGHHTYKSGLLSHTYKMLKHGDAITSVYSLNRDLLLCGILLHDCGKVITTNYDMNEDKLNLNPEYVLLQHLTQGVLLVEKLASKLNIPQEKILLIQHMLASHHGKPEWGSYTYPAFPEAEALHHLDNMDARLDLMYDKIHSSDNNLGIIDRVPKLNNRFLYNFEY